MSYYKIYDQCFHIKNYKYCLHYVLSSYDDKYTLDYGHIIKKNIPYDHPMSEHFKNCDDVQIKGCGNPYNLMSEDENKNIVLKKPKNNSIIDECHTKVSFEKNKSYDEAKKHILEYLGADCWGAYTRNKEHEPIKIFFDMRKFKKSKNIEESHKLIEESDCQKNRYHLIEHIDEYLNEIINNNLTLCIILGCDDFIETYYYPNGDKTFDIISIYF